MMIKTRVFLSVKIGLKKTLCQFDLMLKRPKMSQNLKYFHLYD